MARFLLTLALLLSPVLAHAGGMKGGGGSGSSAPCGSSGAIQYNNGGACGAFGSWNPGTFTLTLPGSANNLTLSGSATTVPVSIAATGSDTNINISLAPKGPSGRTTSTSYFSTTMVYQPAIGLAGNANFDGSYASATDADRSFTTLGARISWTGTGNLLTGNRMGIADFSAYHYTDATLAEAVLGEYYFENLAAGTVSSLEGVRSALFNNNGTVSLMAAFATAPESYGYMGNYGTGTITDLVHFLARRSANSGGGVLTRAYGLKVEDQDAAASNWAIKTGLGQVEFGDATRLPKTGSTFVNYERLSLDWSSDIARIQTEAGGTGTLRALQVSAADITLAPASGSFLNVTREIKLTNQTTTVGASAGTITNAPVVGNPVAWVRVFINGTELAIPAWALP